MTESQEFYAPTVEEAVQKASVALDVGTEVLSYEVVDTGTAGFLGIGAREARITVSSDSLHAFTEVPQPKEEPDHAVDPVVREESADVSANVETESVTSVPEQLIEEVRVLVSAILEAMDLETRIDVYDAGDFIAVDVASQETGLFIGQKGETIDSLQYLINVAIYQKSPVKKRIVLDSEGYRQRRVEAIQGMAHRSARRAVREQRPVELPPMNSSERRIVHIYLKDNATITTASEGNGHERRVKVIPTEE